MNRPQIQHWVPQFYLRHFATQETKGAQDPQVWVFFKEELEGKEEEFLTNVKNVCAKRFLYTPVGEDGERVWLLEEKLGSLETLLSQIWPELADGFPDLGHPALRKGLALFVAVMHLRNPDTRRSIEQLHQKLVETYKRMPQRPDGTLAVESMEIDGVTYSFDSSGWTEYQQWGKGEHDRFFVQMVESHAAFIAELLLTKRWSVIVSDTNFFITTDKPVVVQHPDRATFGFRTNGTIIIFPLSPTRLLVMDDMHSEPANQYYPLKKEHAGGHNCTLWANADRFLITGRSVHEVLDEMVSWSDANEARAPLGPST